MVPVGQYFDLAGNGGYPGIPAYGGNAGRGGKRRPRAPVAAASGRRLRRKLTSAEGLSATSIYAAHDGGFDAPSSVFYRGFPPRS